MGLASEFNFTIATNNGSTTNPVGYTLNLGSLLTTIYNNTDTYTYMLPI